MKISKILLMIITSLAIIGAMNSCKRSSVDDPGMIVNSGFRVILSGVASNSTLYVPDDSTAFSTNLFIEAKDNKGNPLRNFQVIFEQMGPIFGSFESTYVTHSAMTDNSGRITMPYIFPPGIYVSGTQTIQVQVTFVDDGRLDLSGAAVTDLIPIKIIGNQNTTGTMYRLHGDVNTSDGMGGVTGLSDVTISITNLGVDAYTLTNNASGSWEVMVPEGWTGTITPSKSGYNFDPQKRVISKPMSHDLLWEDFMGYAN